MMHLIQAELSGFYLFLYAIAKCAFVTGIGAAIILAVVVEKTAAAIAAAEPEAYEGLLIDNLVTLVEKRMPSKAEQPTPVEHWRTA